MLLLDIEKQIRPLSRAEKMQLIRDIEQMLYEETVSAQDANMHDYFQQGQDVGAYGPVNEPEIAKQLEELLTQ